MKYPSLIIFLCLIITACENKPPNIAKEKMLYGQWMSIDGKYNRERYHFKQDGTFTDNDDNSFQREAKTWEITDDKLGLKYYDDWGIKFNITYHYHIIALNDSVLVMASGTNRHRPSKPMHFKKMKLGGKFING